MQQLNLKPTHKLVKNYYAVLGQFGQLSIDHEGAVKSAFQRLLENCGSKLDLTLVAEYSFQPPKHNPIRIDGALLNPFKLAHGYWEAKDEHDDLDKEIRAKLDKGYPKTNIIFQAPERAVLYQHGVRQGTPEDIRDPKNLVELLKQFFAYREPHIEEWDEAVAEFKDHIPEIAKAVEEKIEDQRRRNPTFVERFHTFYELCRQSINPNLSVQAVEKMLVQHLLTERIFRKIFDNPDFTRRNVIAVEIEKVIDSMTAKQFSRDAFLKDLDRFYRAIELAAENTETYKQKQDFINTVYQRFFQGYSPKEADTHGIVYTPQPIVDFMVRSVEDILQKEFGRSLSDKDVHILDPFVGTGNFITRVMKEIRTSALPYKYENELHCNEVMLLPYYVASMNIEHEYMERTGEYRPFSGICLVDTFELAEPAQTQLSYMTEKNSERVKQQKKAEIFVIMTNPPYNVGQLDENDNNKNRKYPTLDKRVSDSYAASSSASSVSKLNDPYVKAIRWATDRIGAEGVIAFVNNDSFIDQFAFDGMRKELASEFDSIYILDLGGNIRKNPDLSGTTHNVFGIQVGVSINLLVRTRKAHRPAVIHYADTSRVWRKEHRLAFLTKAEDISSVDWKVLEPDAKHTWLTDKLAPEFEAFLPIGSKESKAGRDGDSLFGLYSLGVNTNRDAWAYNFDSFQLGTHMQSTINFYNDELHRWISRTNGRAPVDGFVSVDAGRVSWSEGLKNYFRRKVPGEFNPKKLRISLYRPFTKMGLYFDAHFNERRYKMPQILPSSSSERDNLLLWVKTGSEVPFFALAANAIPNSLPQGGSQCFPFYAYDEDGSNRRENITDWALNEFRTQYNDPSITKWDIFHYVYAVLHHPEYRERYAANLKRELPRIPFVGSAERGTIVAQDPSASLRAGSSPGSAISDDSRVPSGTAQTAGPSTRAEALGRDDTNKENVGRGAEAPHYPNAKGVGDDRGPSTRAGALAQDDTRKLAEDDTPKESEDKSVFWAFVRAGRRLAELHVNYEQQPEFRLERVEKGQLNWRVEKMRLSKDKTALVYNDFLTLQGIPPETYEYRLGNRSALEWAIDQYQVSTDKRSGIVNDPNRADDPEYIVRLIGQVMTVSLETMRIVKSLPALVISTASAESAAG